MICLALKYSFTSGDICLFFHLIYLLIKNYFILGEFQMHIQFIFIIPILHYSYVVFFFLYPFNLLLLICAWEMGYPVQPGQPTRDHRSEETNSLSPSSHKLPIALMKMWGLLSLSHFLAKMLTNLILFTQL